MLSLEPDIAVEAKEELLARQPHLVLSCTQGRACITRFILNKTTSLKLVSPLSLFNMTTKTIVIIYLWLELQLKLYFCPVVLVLLSSVLRPLGSQREVPGLMASTVLEVC